MFYNLLTSLIRGLPKRLHEDKRSAIILRKKNTKIALISFKYQCVSNINNP